MNKLNLSNLASKINYLSILEQKATVGGTTEYLDTVEVIYDGGYDDDPEKILDDTRHEAGDYVVTGEEILRVHGGVYDNVPSLSASSTVSSSAN